MPSSPNSPKLRPSGSSRWIKCKASPGFIAANQHRLPPESSPSADEGTLAHAYAAALLLGKRWDGGKIPDEMHRHVCNYVSYVQQRQRTLPGSKMLVEQTVPVFYSEDQEGTADVVLIATKTLELIDLKYGVAVSVEAERNSQLAIYLESVKVAKKLGVMPTSKVSLTIYQPRAQDNRVVRKWDISYNVLHDFAEEIETTAMEIMLEPFGQEFFAEPKGACRFCPAKVLCTAYASHLLGDTPEEVQEALHLVPAKSVGLPAVASLTTEQLVNIYRKKKDVSAWLEKVEDYLLGLQLSGTSVAGLKLVQGRSNRQWMDEKAALRLLRGRIPVTELMTTAALKSPAQVETLLKNPTAPLTTRFLNRLEKLITKPVGKPILTTEDDTREAVKQNPIAEFTDLTTSEESILL